MASRGMVRLRSVFIIGNYQLSRNISLQGKVINSGARLYNSRFRHFCASANIHSDHVDVRYENGLPIISVPLPSRREKCKFTLRPISNTLGDFMTYIEDEDHGVDRVAAYNPEGERLAKSTPIDILLQKDFHLVINDDKYLVKTSISDLRSHEHLTDLSDVKNTIAQLYSSLNVEQFQLERERELQGRLEEVKQQLAPMEKLLKNEIELKAKQRTTTLSWLGLGLMGLQFGVLARLTWWEYSWDIMEPVTYFVTYGTSMAMYAYYVLTKQEYVFPNVRDREYLLTVHKHTKKLKLDAELYNRLKLVERQCETDLLRLRDPLQLQLPIQQLQPKSKSD